MGRLLDKYRSLARPAKAALWFVFCGVLQKGIGVIVTPIFTRIMSTEDYGIYTLFTSWVDLLAVVVTLRLSWGVFMQGLVRYDYDEDEYTSSLQGLTTLLVAAGVLVYLLFRDFFNALTGLNTFLMLCCFASAWSAAMFGFWSTRQRVAYNYRALVVVTLAVSAATPAAGILAVLSVDTHAAEARIVCLVAIEFVVYAAMFCYYMAKGRRFYQREHWIHALRFNVPLVPHYLSQSALSQAGRVMIGSMVGKTPAAIFGLSNSVASIMGVFNQAVMNALNPWIYQKIRDGASGDIARVSYLCIAVIGAANLFLIAFAPEVIWLFAPSEYYEGIWIIPPLAASSFVTFMYSLFADFEFYYEKTAWVAAASIVAAALVIGLNYVLIPRFGYLVAGWTTLFGYGVYIAMHYVFMRGVQKAEMGGERVYEPKVLVALLAGFGTAAALLMASYPYPVVRYAFAVALLIAVYVKREKLLRMAKELKTAGGSVE